MSEFPISGYHGRVLVADLTRGEVRTVPLDPDTALLYLGGRGLATRLFCDAVDPACDPLGPETSSPSPFPRSSDQRADGGPRPHGL